MPQYVITGKDGNDADALKRRMDARPFHLEGARKLKANGQFILGGATLDDQGKMNGSVMVVAFDTKEQLQHYLDQEPYIKDGVWKEVDVQPFKVADV